MQVRMQHDPKLAKEWFDYQARLNDAESSYPVKTGRIRFITEAFAQRIRDQKWVDEV